MSVVNPSTSAVPKEPLPYTNGQYGHRQAWDQSISIAVLHNEEVFELVLYGFNGCMDVLFLPYKTGVIVIMIVVVVVIVHGVILMAENVLYWL